MDTAVGLPDTSTFTPDLPDTSGFTTKDSAKQTFIQLHPGGPEEGMAALHAADALSPVIHPAITANHPDLVGQNLWSKFTGGAKELYEKTKGTVEGFINHANANALNAR